MTDRSTFKVRDLLIEVIPTRGGGGGGEAGLIGPDQDITDFTPITPIVMTANANMVRIEKLIKVAHSEDRLAEVVGSRHFEKLAEVVGRQVAGGAVLAGSAALPADDCSASLPTPITPIGIEALGALSIRDLPILKQRLTDALEVLERVEQGLAPQRDEVKGLTKQLHSALEELG